MTVSPSAVEVAVANALRRALPAAPASCLLICTAAVSPTADPGLAEALPRAAAALPALLRVGAAGVAGRLCGAAALRDRDRLRDFCSPQLAGPSAL
jgi:hypothetical protein